jgi:hypothetical protein
MTHLQIGRKLSTAGGRGSSDDCWQVADANSSFAPYKECIMHGKGAINPSFVLFLPMGPFTYDMGYDVYTQHVR